MKKNKNILITGGAGFIGSHLIERLLNHAGDYRIKIVDNLHRNAIRYSSLLNKESRNKGVEFVQGNILDLAALNKEMEGADLIIHMAAIAGVSNYYKFPALTLKTNLIGTYNVLETMLKNNVKRIIDFSTSEVFGPLAIDVNEDSYFNIGPPQDKRWCYAGSKIGGEQLIFRYAEEYGWNATIIRPFNIYGPRQIGEGAISNFCKNVLQGEPLKIEGTGSAIRSWCYISDFIDAMMKIINDPHDKIEAFNIGNPWAIATNVSLSEMVLKNANEHTITGCPTPVFVPMNYSEIKVRYPDISKMQKFYDWKPQVNLEDGIKNTFKWFLEKYEKN